MTLYMKHKYYPRHSSCLCSPWPRIFPSSPRLHNKLNPPDCDCWLSVDLCDIFRCLLSLNSLHPDMWDVNSDKCQPFQQIFWIVSPGNSLDNLWGAAGIETTCDMRHLRVHSYQWVDRGMADPLFKCSLLFNDCTYCFYWIQLTENNDNLLKFQSHFDFWHFAYKK